MTPTISVARQSFAKARSDIANWNSGDDERPVAVQLHPQSRQNPTKVNVEPTYMIQGPLLKAVQGVADGTVTSMQLVQESLAAIENYTDLNAFAYVDAEAALREAEVLDREAKEGKLRGLLHGIPVSVKDVIHVANMPTRCGSDAYEFTPSKDAEAVALLRSAGAVIIGKTTTHEFALGVTTPQAKNPYDQSRIPGGSSGGSAIAIAKGMGLASLGTDTRASIRVPAALSGVVGFKPTFGRVPTRGVVPLSWTMDHAAPMALTVSDIAYVLDALITPSPDLSKHVGSSIDGVRIGISQDVFDGCNSEVAFAISSAIADLESMGAKIVTVDKPSKSDLDLANSVGLIVSRSEAVTFHRGIGTDLSRCWAETRDQLDEAKHVLATEYITAQRCRHQLASNMLAVFNDVDVLAMPTSLVVAPTRADAEQYLLVLSRNAILWSFIGFPAVSIPCKNMVDELPVGLQLVGAPYEEGTLIALGSAYESHI